MFFNGVLGCDCGLVAKPPSEVNTQPYGHVLSTQYLRIPIYLGRHVLCMYPFVLHGRVLLECPLYGVLRMYLAPPKLQWLEEDRDMVYL